MFRSRVDRYTYVVSYHRGRYKVRLNRHSCSATYPSGGSLPVKRVFATADVDPRDRSAYWHDVVCSNIVDRDFSPESGQTFQAELHLGAIANIRLALCAT